MQAMILAAGFGTRLRPYSLHRPKPLFPVLGKPLILHTIERLRESGFRRIIVNAHYLREQIVDLLAAEKDVDIQQELVELGTGGGLRMAYSSFGSEPVLVTNGDIYHDIDYAKVYADHCSQKALVSMIMHDYPRFNKVGIDEGNMVVHLSGQEELAKAGSSDTLRQLAFTGIHVISPEVLCSIPEAVFYNIIDCYSHHLANGGIINAVVEDDHFWQDIGTPEDYLDLHRNLLQGKPYLADHLEIDKSCYVAADNELAGSITFADWSYVGKNVTIGAGAHLERVVVWDGAVIAPGSILHDDIVYR